MNTELIAKAYKWANGVWPEGYTALVISTSKNPALGPGQYCNCTFDKTMFDQSCGNPSHWLWVCTKAEFEEYAKTHNKPEINWDEAPEGATACFKRRKSLKWLKKDTNGNIHMYSKSMDDWLRYLKQEEGAKYYDEAVKNPYPWTPEVGEMCEVSWYGSWQQTFIVGKDSDGDLVYETTGFSESGHFEVADSSTEFRPLRKETMWYDNLRQGVLCWVWVGGYDDYKFKRVIKKKEGDIFADENGARWNSAQPLTKEEALQYVYEERKDK